MGAALWRSQHRLAAAGEPRYEAAVSQSSATSAESTQLFLTRYAQASARLKAGLLRMHGKGRFREFRGREAGGWITFEFFIDNGKLRVDREYSANDHSASASVKRPDALLLTPKTAAKVIDPGTEFAWPKYISQKPNMGFDTEVARTVWRFLLASYSFDEASIGERMADGRFTLRGIERDPATNGWLHVKCGFVEPAEDPKWTAHGTFDLWLDESQDFVIRKTHLVSFEPYMYEVVREVGPFIAVGDGGWLPKSMAIHVYDLRKPPPAGLDEQCPWKERIQFELLGEIDTGAIPSTYFTLESLGINSPRHRFKGWAFLAVTLVLTGLVALRKRRARNRSAVSVSNPST